MNSSHFTGLRILSLLDLRSYDKTSAGFIDARYLVQKFETDYDLKGDCENSLNLFLSKGVIESNNRLEEYSQNVDQVRITSFGKYILDYLAFSFTYLDLICLDCRLFDESVANFLIDASYNEVDFYQERKLYDRVVSRLDRVDWFISDLHKQEEREFLELNLPPTEIKFTSIRGSVQPELSPIRWKSPLTSDCRPFLTNNNSIAVNATAFANPDGRWLN